MTLVTLPWVAVTVMPAAGSASRLPSAGVIFRSAAACAACADAAAEADAAAWAGVCACPPQAAASRLMTAAAAMLTYVRARLPRTLTLLEGRGLANAHITCCLRGAGAASAGAASGA